MTPRLGSIWGRGGRGLSTDPRQIEFGGIGDQVKRVRRSFFVLTGIAVTVIVVLVSVGAVALLRLSGTTEELLDDIVRTNSEISAISAELGTLQRLELESVIADDRSGVTAWHATIDSITRHLDGIGHPATPDANLKAAQLADILHGYRATAEPLIDGLRDRMPLDLETINAVLSPARPHHREAEFALGEITAGLSELHAATQAETRRERQHLTRRLQVTGAGAAALSAVAFLVFGFRSRRVVRELAALQFVDAGTGLLNRLGLRAWFDTENGASPAPERSMAIIDIDYFQVVNDAAGFAEGDRLLLQVAGALQDSLDEVGALARVGSNRFALAAIGHDKETTEKWVASALETVRNTTFDLADGTHRITASAGVCHLRPTDDFDESIATCEAALLIARSGGRDRHIALDLAEDTAPVRVEMQRARTIHRILDDGLLRLSLQAIEPLDPDGSLEPWCEVLVRGVDPDSGRELSAAEIVAPGEQFGVIARVDSWVISSVIERLTDSEFDRFGRVHVNVSAQSLTNPTFTSELAGLLALHTSEARRLCFEITETSLVYDLAATNWFIAMVRSYGATVAIDDFGTGAATFSLLRSLDLDSLKIDGQFVRSVADDDTDRAVVRSIVEVAHTLELRTIAEWVETAEQAAILAELGVDYMQGYHAHRPSPLTPRQPAAKKSVPW